ncbi:hypothetical protein E2C01_070306 [Portunus trituberculatus]|uniref:Uncharacterized protein n=1 Tax=Portunus trituberculatus TaxID=210409 RepID=A0A5B7I1R2_PORTR|nr:hypothetical protein [Portunus trituberculatus]
MGKTGWVTSRRPSTVRIQIATIWNTLLSGAAHTIFMHPYTTAQTEYTNAPYPQDISMVANFNGKEGL